MLDDYSPMRLALANVRIQMGIALMLTTTVLTITMAYAVVRVRFDVDGHQRRSWDPKLMLTMRITKLMTGKLVNPKD